MQNNQGKFLFDLIRHEMVFAHAHFYPFLNNRPPQYYHNTKHSYHKSTILKQF